MLLKLSQIYGAVYFCAYTEMEKSVGAAPQHPDSFPPSILSHSSQGESFFLLPRASLAPQSPFYPILRWGTPGEEINQSEGHQPPSLGGFWMGSTRKWSAKRQYGGKSRPKITPGDPAQHLGSPAVFPNYQLSRSSTSFHAGT